MKMTIEFGSNACKVLQMDAGKVLKDERLPLRLYSFLDKNGNMTPSGIRRIARILTKHKAELDSAESYRIVGTKALRMAKNGVKIQNEVQKESGYKLEILSEEEEASATFKGVMDSLQLKGRVLVMDIGGGSLELIYGHNGEYQNSFSLPLGAALLDNNFRTGDPYPGCAYQQMQSYVEKQIQVRNYKDMSLVGAGGCISTMMAVAMKMKTFKPEKIEGQELHRMEVHRQFLQYRSMSIDQIKEIPGMDSERADIILAAAMIVHNVLHKTELYKLQVSTRGLRHGLIS